MLEIELTGWSALFLGLFLIATALGELRRPGGWQEMIDGIEGTPAMQLAFGLLELLTGVLIYIANPWNPHDLLACVMHAIGGLMAVEALLVIMLFDLYHRFWMRRLGTISRSWALVALAAGLALAGAGAVRMG